MSNRQRRSLEDFNRRGRKAKQGGDADEGPRSKRERKEQEERERKQRRIFWGIMSALTVGAMLIFFFFNPAGFTQVKTSEGRQILQSQSIERIQVTDGSQIVQIWLKDDYKPTDLEGKKQKPTKKVQFQYTDPEGDAVLGLVQRAKSENGYNSIVPQQSLLFSLLSFMLPMLLIVGLFFWMIPKMQGRMNEFGKVKRDGVESDLPDVTFADVAGVDEAVEELREIKEFIETPEKFYKMGAKIPRGVLLYGPPGTGKTLLAKAVAGEAGVPFFHISASEFVEMFVGVGASRVRDLFTKAKKVAPAIIFVDEIDAVGRNRGAGIGGGNDEREQTLNQLLVEMDGFDERTNVIVIAATNRPDVLDPALLRPGRFDRQIGVDAPDLPGRQEILKVHADGKPLEEGVSLESIARRTPGFSGADLANLLNEAALLAARRGHTKIDEDDIDEAIDRVIAGPQRRTRVMNPKEKRMTAYHEAGHAVAAAALNHTDPVTKVTILPRGRALGYTMVMPTEDRYSTSRHELLDEMVYAMGGRAAEEVVFHDPTTGASNDIQKATSVARKMVTEYGMSQRVGAVRLTADDSDPMTRMGGGQAREHSDDLARIVDEEVRTLLDRAAQEAWQIMMDNRHVLDRLTSVLLEKETVLEGELKEIFKDIVKAPARQLWLSSPERPVSDLPPVPLPEAPKADDEAEAGEGSHAGAGDSADAGQDKNAEDSAEGGRPSSGSEPEGGIK
ncbi:MULTISPECIES: ATP-dependent zinc metalloprotease FtsH [Trueperella]|uniref:ATP-dependent zinc metalloprotease FtsH n=1 Tax=Trueperella bernardiae TaxID=59561 RepID=A0AAW6ZJA9_9ACTO|nr:MULTISPECIES: ATP-dependent zinc metalloprotease FtsH [Trueperella]MCM3907934.1 ATP-dependent zinc metalloprotease FtsH [Trueperella bernardiae]MDK8601710.1 ATP-dependent zinc metalloprotease FtsH [Trueperella bernardiae]MDV6238586.1 ATP-dependent zinc metalloprotease FtsH [Trueperella bernardiae]